MEKVFSDINHGEIYRLACPECHYGKACYSTSYSGPAHIFYCPRCGYMLAVAAENPMYGDYMLQDDCHIVECNHPHYATWTTPKNSLGRWHWLCSSCGEGGELEQFVHRVTNDSQGMISGGYIYPDGTAWFAKDLRNDAVYTFDAWIEVETKRLASRSDFDGFCCTEARKDTRSAIMGSTTRLPHAAKGVAPISAADIEAEVGRRQHSWEVARCPQPWNLLDSAGIRRILERQQDFYTAMSESKNAWRGDRRRAHFYRRVLDYMNRGHTYSAVSAVAIWDAGDSKIESALLLPAHRIPYDSAPEDGRDLEWGYMCGWANFGAMDGVPEADILRLREEVRNDARTDPETPVPVRDICLAHCGKCKVGLFGPFCSVGGFFPGAWPNSGVHPKDKEECTGFELEWAVLGQDA